MTPSSTSDAGATSPAGSRLVRALPWGVVVAAVATLTPILTLDALVLLAHLPTFVVLLVLAIDLAGRMRKGESVSPVGIAGSVGGLGASVALMGVMAIGTIADGTAAIFYFFTWMLLPIFAVVGSGLAAALAGVWRFVSTRTSNA